MAITRCSWAGDDPLYQRYHDEEWGFPIDDDRRLFEKIALEGFQAGLSWLTILRKREAFRAAFENFEIERLARYRRGEVERLLRDERIVRHRGKIEAAISNASRAIDLQREYGSLAAYFWEWEKGDPAALARDLKRRGWTFVGPTTVYSFMQAMGLVNDHERRCAVRTHAADARARFRVPAFVVQEDRS